MHGQMSGRIIVWPVILLNWVAISDRIGNGRYRSVHCSRKRSSNEQVNKEIIKRREVNITYGPGKEVFGWSIG